MSLKESRSLAQRGTWTASLCMLLSVSCSSTNDAEKTDATAESGGNDGSGGRSTGGATATGGGNSGGGGQNAGGRVTSTGGASAGGGGGSTMSHDCIGPGYYCSAGTVSIVDRSGVPAGESCMRIVHHCTSGCRLEHVATSSTSTLPAPESLCNESDGGVVDAGPPDRSDSGHCDGGAEAGCASD